MAVKVTTKITTTVPQKIEGAWKKSLPVFSTQVLKDMSHYVPRDAGTLERNAYTSSDFSNGVLRWAEKYARFLWYGFVMVDPATGSPWAKKGHRKVVTNRAIDYRGGPIRGAMWTLRAEKTYKRGWLTVLSNLMKGNL